MLIPEEKLTHVPSSPGIHIVHYPQIDKFKPTTFLCSKTIYFKCEVSRASKKGQITNCSTLKKSFWQQQPFLGMNFNNVR